MTRWLRVPLVLLAVLLPAACTDQAAVDGQLEIAGELRALRAALQDQPPRHVPARPEFDRAALTKAMEPLREVLVGLVREQDAIQTQQTALTEELKRWSQLLVQSTTGGNQEEARTLVTRLEQLELQMGQQDARHREVEALLIQALDSTAERLEDFLKRLGEIGEPDAVTPEPAPANPAGTGPDKGNGGGDEPPAAKERLGANRWGSARSPSAWWFAIGAAAVVLGGVFVFWLGRENRAATVEPSAEPLRNDDDTQQLWAAAALLGEAVGRLRDQDHGEARQVESELDLDDVFVLEEDVEEDPEHDPIDPMAGPGATVAESEPQPAAGPTDAGPYAIGLRLAVTAPEASKQRVLEILRADPRVLPNPEPTVTVHGRWLEIAYAVLPQLGPGERTHLELSVRDAAR